MKTANLFELSNELCQRREPHAWITVVAVKSPSSAYVGAQAIVTLDGQVHGWIGGGCVQSTARTVALGSLTSMTPQRLRLSNTNDGGEDPDVRPMNCPSNGEIELFIQPVAVTPRLRVYGTTPVARAAARLAQEADFDVLTDAEIADSESPATTQPLADQAFFAGAPPTPDAMSSLGSEMRTPTMGPKPVHMRAKKPAAAATPAPAAANTPATGTATSTSAARPSNLLSLESYALIATQGDGDEAALETALRSPAWAVLVIASKRKAERLRKAMALRGVPEARIAVMRAPAGPNIGAITPIEIALAAIAGLVALRRGRPTEGGVKPDSRAVNSAHATGYVNPVCGAVVDPARALSTLTMGGQTHYFCCTGCRVEFECDPEKYLAIAAHMRAPVRRE